MIFSDIVKRQELEMENIRLKKELEISAIVIKAYQRYAGRLVERYIPDPHYASIFYRGKDGKVVGIVEAYESSQEAEFYGDYKRLTDV